MIQHARAAASSATGTTTRRNQQSCQQCRRDKQKCLPATRDWKYKKEKCERCKKLDHPCGPSLKSQKRLSNTYISDIRMDAMAQMLADYPNLKIADTAVTGKSSYQSTESPLEQSTMAALECHSNISRNCRNSLGGGRETVGDILDRLADMNTAREMLLAARKYTECMRLWFREESVFVQTLDVFIEDVETHFHRDIAAAIDNVGIEGGPESDIAISAILQSHQRFSYPHILGARRTISAESSYMQKLLHLSRRTRNCAKGDKRIGSTREIISSDDDKYHTVLAYVDASDAIAHVLETINSGSKPLRAQQSRRFSGDQIAYMYGNNAATLQLWSHCQEKGPSADILGRNLLHLVVHNSDHEMLRRILSLHGTYATAIDATDIFGVTPIEIAVCQNDPKCFSLLKLQGARGKTAFGKHGDNLLALAKRNNSSDVLRLMFEGGKDIPLSFVGASEDLRLEDQIGIKPTISCLGSAASSPGQISKVQTAERDTVQDSSNFMPDEVQLSETFLASDLVKDEFCFSVLDQKPLLSFDNFDDWDGWDSWLDQQGMDMDTEVHFRGDVELTVGDC